jgi:glycogen debranching enzyme
VLADKVKVSFEEKFWNEHMGCLYDVIDGEVKDDSLRPNQIYAVSLPFAILSEDKAASVVRVVQEKLYAGCGIRSLSPEHKDYHPVYCGSLPKRDAAYHQGTAWGFLLGGFVSAYLKVNHHSKESVQQALEFLAPVKEHFRQNCIGSISEIFDGDEPHLGRGCYAQAWSVGETLRCYVEDILPYSKNINQA